MRGAALSVGFWLAGSAAVAAPPAPDWCRDVGALLLTAESGQQANAGDVEALLTALPKEIGVSVRGDMGREGSVRAAFSSAEFAAKLVCNVDAKGADPGTVAAEVAGILSDSRFAGLRTEDNFTEKAKDRLWRLLQELIDSEGMQLFADNSRIFYVGGLAIVSSFVAARLLLRLRRPPPAASAAGSGTRVERERQRAFAVWRAEALPLVDDASQSRQALLLLRAALLARVGEAEIGGRDAVKPQRTSREILLRLAPDVGAVVGPALTCFDEAFYGGHAEPVIVRRFLGLVDVAAARRGNT